MSQNGRDHVDQADLTADTGHCHSPKFELSRCNGISRISGAYTLLHRSTIQKSFPNQNCVYTELSVGLVFHLQCEFLYCNIKRTSCFCKVNRLYRLND